MLDHPAGAPQAPPVAARDRSLSRVSADPADQAPLSGAAVLAILRRRKLALLLPMLLMPLLAIVALSQLNSLYTATGTLLYDASEYRLRELQSIQRVDPITDAVMATQAEVLRGLPIVEQVANRLNLHSNPEFNWSLRPVSLLRRTLAAAQHWLAHS